MSQEDMKGIFGNIHELVQLSGILVERLEVALNGRMGSDRVGTLFLEMVR